MTKKYYIFTRDQQGWMMQDSSRSIFEIISAVKRLHNTKEFMEIACAVSENGEFPHVYRTMKSN